MIWLNLIQLQRAQTDVKWDPKIDVKRIWMPKYIYTQKTWKQECHFVQYSPCRIQTRTSTTKGFGQGPLYWSNFPEKTSVLSGFPAYLPFPSVPLSPPRGRQDEPPQNPFSLPLPRSFCVSFLHSNMWRTNPCLPREQERGKARRAMLEALCPIGLLQRGGKGIDEGVRGGGEGE